MNMYKIFAINPGSTSTKIALFEDDRCLFSKTIEHEASKLAEFKTINEQLPYRKKIILEYLKENRVNLEGTNAFVARGGSLIPMESGVYEIDDLVLEHTKMAVGGVIHPANLGVQIAKELCLEFKVKGFTVNPPVVDEFQDLARVTGIKGVYRPSQLHTLNLKETAIRHAESIGKKYEDCNFVVCHIGGGISVSAHRNGKMIDGNDIAGGEGPMAPTRCGGISVANILKYLEKNDLKDVRALCTRSGGFVSHLGTADAKEVTKRAAEGDKTAAMVWNTMIYQIIKDIGAMSTVLKGKVDSILLGGGMVHNKDLVHQIEEACKWIAPVSAYPGEFEMEALAAGALRVLKGLEKAKKYTGIPVWVGLEK